MFGSKKKFCLSVFVFASMLFFYGFVRWCATFNDGFCRENIISYYDHNPKWDLKDHFSDYDEIQKILSQKYTYLGKGCQSYVFEGVEGNYVLKIFKCQHFRPRPWVQWMQKFPIVNHYFERKNREKMHKREGIYDGCFDAFRFLQEETGIVFVHLNKTEIWPKFIIHLQDQRKQDYFVDADQLEFYIQKKATLFWPYLYSLIKNREIMQAKKLIKDLFSLLLSEFQKGYRDQDRALLQNMGVCNNVPLHLDIGQIVKDPKCKEEKIINAWLPRITKRLHSYLQSENQELANYLEDQLTKVSNKDFP